MIFYVTKLMKLKIELNEIVLHVVYLVEILYNM